MLVFSTHNPYNKLICRYIPSAFMDTPFVNYLKNRVYVKPEHVAQLESKVTYVKVGEQIIHAYLNLIIHQCGARRIGVILP